MSFEEKKQQELPKTKMIFSKKWDDYFLEFLVLLLAVTLGFFIENYRVELTNREKEKDYIISMIQDARTDKVHIAAAIKLNKAREKWLDSLSHILLEKNLNANEIKKLYAYYAAVIKHPDFITPTSVTLQQLKSTGSMRLIKNKTAIKAIIQYDQVGKKLENQQMYYETYQMNAINVGSKVINLTDFTKLHKKSITPEDLTLLTNDQALIVEFGNMVFMFQGIVNYYRILLQRMNKEAGKLIEVLTKEYELNDA